jgi:Phosphotransferase enzyme family
MTDISQEFSDFMDPDKMMEVFQQHLPECQSGVLRLTKIAIQHPRFKTYLNPKSREKSSLALAYHLSGFNEQANKSENRILYAKVYLGERSILAFQEACSETASDRKEIIHLSEYGLVAWFFPNDPALPWLVKILNVDFIKQYFVSMLFSEWNAPVPVVNNIQIKIINYRPEIRCTCRYEVLRLSKRKQYFYSKTFADKNGSEILSRMVTLYQRSIANPASFTIAQPLGYDESIQTLWMEGLVGHAFADLIKESKAEQLISHLAGCLADFHHADIPNLTVIKEDFLLEEIKKKSAKLKQAFPAYNVRIEKLLMNLEQQRPELPFVKNTLIHGDFHIQQLILLDDNRIALFDFDELAQGNPLIDIANFCADLFNLNFDYGLAAQLTTSFFSAYQKINDVELNHNHFEWHLRIQLMTRAYRAYIQQKPGLDSLLNRLLEVAEYGYSSIHINQIHHVKNSKKKRLR